MLPSLYVSHGSPAIMMMTNKTTRFFNSLPSIFERPKYILVISAHWTSQNLEILKQQNLSLIYDFYGFPKELYEQEYPAHSNKEKEDEIVELLLSNNIKISKNSNRNGYDHGVWSILSLMYPKANIPVIQLSLPMSFSVEKLIALGEALIPLRENTLILGSGSLTHNLGTLEFGNEHASIHKYARKFRDWIVEKIESSDTKALIEIRDAPYLRENHPTLEHLLPLFINYGASSDKRGKSLHDIFMYGNLSMDTIIFEK